ncbi:MAG: hypothetical protein Q4B73_06135 [Lachnospiraceae bacterium]|nr:hypothetical protein [Lachnospiraceae bacterium]
MDTYDDIIDLPHPVSKKHKPMSLRERAAQFAPFAALTGYDAMTQERARTTEARIELDETAREELDRTYFYLKHHLEERPRIMAVWFEADALKEGGAYKRAVGYVQRLDESRGIMRLEDGTAITLADLLELRIENLPLSFCEDMAIIEKNRPLPKIATLTKGNTI